MDYLKVIRTGFAKLWGAQVLSLIAQNLLNFSLIIRVYELAQGTRFANSSVSLLILSFGVPSVLFAAVAGIYVDHWDRKLVMVVSNLTRAVLVLLYLVSGFNLLVVLVLTFLISSITQFFTPAEAAAIPALVGDKLLIAANSLFVLTFYACFIIGYSAAAPIILAFGRNFPYVLTSAMFGVAAVLAVWLPRLMPRHKTSPRFGELVAKTGAEMRKNWRTIKSQPQLYFPIIQLSIIQALIGVVLALAPALSKALLKVPLEDASHVLVIPAGIGMVLGVLLVGQLAKRRPKLAIVTTGLVATGAALTALGLTGQLYRTIHGNFIATQAQVAVIVAGLLAILGLMNAVISVAAQTMLQEGTTDQTRGKVFGALNMMINIAATLPVFLAGIFADLFSVTKVIDFVGLAILAYAIVQVLYMRRFRAA